MCAFFVLLPRNSVLYANDNMTPAKAGSVYDAADLSRDMSRITYKAKSLREFQLAADVFEKKWRGNGGAYTKLMMHTLEQLATSAFNQPLKQSVLERKYALLALSSAKNLTVGQQVFFVLRLTDDYSDKFGPDKEKWAAKRREYAIKWMQVYQRLDAAQDKKFDFSDEPFFNVPPPSPYRTRISPSAIKEPKLRSEYELALARNEKKAKAYSEQLKLRELRELLLSRLVPFLTNAYSRSPENITELSQELNKFVQDGDLRDAIIARTKKKIETEQAFDALRNSVSHPSDSEDVPTQNPSPISQSELDERLKHALPIVK